VFFFFFGGQYDNQSATDFINYNDVYIYNECTNNWSFRNVTGTKPAARVFAAGWYKEGNKYQIVGGGSFGKNTSLGITLYNDTWEYNDDTLTWTQIMPTGASIDSKGLLGPDVVVKQNRYVFIFGGITLKTTPSFQITDQNTLYKYDMATNQLTNLNPTGAVPIAMHNPVLIDLLNPDTFEVYSGDLINSNFVPTDLLKYDISSNKWINVTEGSQIYPRQYFTGARLRPFFWYGFGGSFPDGNNAVENTTSETYEFSTLANTFTLLDLNEKPPSLTRHRVAKGWGPWMFLVGGFSDEGTGKQVYLKTIWKFSAFDLDQ